MSGAVQVESLWNGLYDSNGVPLGGGKVWTYYAGTTAIQTTWQDRLKVAVHANPIVLDATGRALVFAQGFYKFDVLDSNDVPQFTYDNLAFSYTDEASTAPAASPFPVGSILAFGGSPAPAGYLMCDGLPYSRTTYSALYGVIGITFGAGDGVSTFNVPDFRGRSPLGKAASGTGSALGVAFGSLDFSVTIPAHYHGMGAGADLRINASGGLGTTGEGDHVHNLNSKYNTTATHSHQGSPGYIAEAASPSAGDSSPAPTTGPAGAHSHTVPDHTHGSDKFAGSIGTVTGGVNGNLAMSSVSGSANHAVQVCNFIIKT